MALGGVLRRGLLAGIAGLALWAASPAAGQERGAAGAPGPTFFAPGARVSEPLPTFRDAPVAEGARASSPWRPVRLPSLAHRAGEGLPLPGHRPDGVPLYGVLAGRALVSALHAGDLLPEATTPWFDGDADRLVAGFEFSF